MSKSWFFQANSDFYRIRDALASLKQIRWAVKQYQSQVHIDDTVYLWETGANGGLLAKARVATEPCDGVDPPHELPYYVTPPTEPSWLGVNLEIERVYAEPLKRPALLENVTLANTQLIRNPRGTNFPMTEDEVVALEGLLAEVKPSFQEIIRRYHDERVVFSSPERGALYSIVDVDERGCDVARLSAQEPARVTFNLHASRIEALKEKRSPQHKSTLDHTVTVVATLLLSPQIALCSNRTEVVPLLDEEAAIAQFCDLVAHLNVDQSSGKPRLYKPIMLTVLIEAIAAGEIPDHRIPFSVLLPRFLAKASAVGIESSATQAAMAYFHLTGDLFWCLAYHDIDQRIDSNNLSPNMIEQRVSHAVLKEPYRWILRNPNARRRVHDAIAKAWFDDEELKVQPRFWWVNQGGSFEKERANGTIWCPQIDKSGSPQHHWTNLSKVKPGDVVIHYARQEIRALSMISEGPNVGSKPKEIAIADEWQRPGWFAKVAYFDLPVPVEQPNLREMLRKTAIDGGPFNKNGDINQGYLFPLNDRAVALIAEQLELDVVPAEIADELRAAIERRWDQFIHWGKRFFETGDIRAQERKWKVDGLANVSTAVEQFRDRTAEWPAALKRAFAKNDSATDFRAHDDLFQWIVDTPEKSSPALAAIWDTNLAPQAAVDNFWAEIPTEVVSGIGVRTNLASFLIGERDPADLPLFRSDPFTLAFSLTGYWRKARSPGELYSLALEFLDRVIAEAGKRGLQLSDRLDAQSLMWSVVKRDPPQEWSVAEQEQLRTYRQGQDTTVNDPPDNEDDQPLDTIEALAADLLVSPNFIRETERLLQAKGQLIFYGPPGTGKTFVAKRLAKHFAGAGGEVEIVQFHPSYTYEDFVEGYRPRHRGEQVGFELVRGPLLRLARRATKNPEHKFVLLIDEINRGNVAKIFGELYFLLEYRDERIRLQYDHRKKFALPKNLWIMGTMNTADRSIALIDAALRRRFFFVPFFPDEEPINGLLERWLQRERPQMVWVANLVDRANKLLGDRHGAIGPSHFMRPELDDKWLALIWKHAIMPYLAEQFFGEEERLKELELTALKAESTLGEE